MAVPVVVNPSAAGSSLQLSMTDPVKAGQRWRRSPLVYPNRDNGQCGKFSATRYVRLSQLPVSVANQQWDTNSDLQVARNVTDQGPDTAFKVPDVPSGLCVSDLDEALNVPDVPADCGSATGACQDGDAAAGGCKDMYDAKGAGGGHGRGCESPSPTHRPAVDLTACGPRFHDGPIHVAATQPQMETFGHPQVALEPSIPMSTGCVWTFQPPDNVRMVPWYGPGHPPLCWVLAWGAYVEQLAMHGVWELSYGSWNYHQLW